MLNVTCRKWRNVYYDVLHVYESRVLSLCMLQDSAKCQFFTGFPNVGVFLDVFEFVEPDLVQCNI